MVCGTLLLACRMGSRSTEKPSCLFRGPAQYPLDLAPGGSPARDPLGHDGAGLDEELGAGRGEGSGAATQSARSPGVEARCSPVRCTRSW